MHKVTRPANNQDTGVSKLFQLSHLITLRITMAAAGVFGVCTRLRDLPSINLQKLDRTLCCHMFITPNITGGCCRCVWGVH